MTQAWVEGTVLRIARELCQNASAGFGDDAACVTPLADASRATGIANLNY